MPTPGQRFEQLTSADVERLKQQRAVIERFLGDDETNWANYSTPPGKLGLIRAVLEAKVFNASDTYELQCLGIILGDAFVQECGWLWRMVEDEYGRDPCVKVPGSSMSLFPLTMISKRIERGEDVDVFALFNMAAADVEERAMSAEPLAD
ncbi:MAG TPA: DUF3806 domain-containing protein [Lacipirellulaceae bacterium]|jgi:hypothetical protein|nr:DUF3806 domain-containing protein [Lacipirellulaceae bacterium]